MIIKYNKYEGKDGMYVNINVNNLKKSPSGKSMSTFVGEKETIILSKDGKEVTITGKELINKLF